MTDRSILLTLLLLGGSLDMTTAAGAEALWRRPADCVFNDDAQVLWIANRGAGSLTRFDTIDWQPGGEFQLGRSLVDLEPVPNQPQLVLSLDSAANELLLIDTASDSPQVLSRCSVAPYSRRIAVSADGGTAYVTSLWSQALTVVRIDPTYVGEGVLEPEQAVATSRLTVAQTVPLPFYADQLLPLPEHGKVLIADAFRARLAIVAADTLQVEAIREFPGHNIRTLALSRDGERLLVVQQHLNTKAQADFDDVTWGILLFNGVRSLSLARVLDPTADLLDDNRGIALGMAEDHAGDPGMLVQTPTGRMAAVLTGSGAVAVGTDRFDLRPVEVGRHPVAAVFSPDEKLLFVVNEFSDSVSVIDTGKSVLLREVPLGPPAELTAAQRGELLFFDARLSLDRWMSCNSCHTFGHSVDELVDTLGDGDYGAPKRIPSLLGIGDTAPHAWNGSLPDLEDQVRKSVRSTMHGAPLSDDQVHDLAAYLRSLKLPEVNAHVDPEARDGLVEAGRVVFETQRCHKCHVPPLYTSPQVYDVGLVDESGRSEFNPPSLRGVSLRQRWLHDGRAARLEDVWEVHGHFPQSPLSPEDSAALLAFLRSL